MAEFDGEGGTGGVAKVDHFEDASGVDLKLHVVDVVVGVLDVAGLAYGAGAEPGAGTVDHHLSGCANDGNVGLHLLQLSGGKGKGSMDERGYSHVGGVLFFTVDVRHAVLL